MTAKENKRKPARKRRPYMRKSLQRKPKDTVLIACEGGKTEPIYFEALKQDKRLLSVTIAGKECGSHPISVVRYAKKLKEEGLEFDIIWCVFDRDSHDITRLRQAFDQARANDINIAFSNPCFELWLFLHYDEQNRHVERNALCRKLKKHIPDYEKSMDVYSIILPGQKDAIKRAKKLRENHSGDDRERPDQNPSTGVDILVEYLNSISEDQ